MGLEEKILSVIDIYDAMVAHDRPYKPAIPVPDALEILRAEARAGHLDSTIIEFFIRQDVYKIFSNQ